VNKIGIGKDATQTAGVLLIGVVGLIHLFEAPEYFEVAAYVGVLFVANFLAASLSAYGILRDKGWGWIIGVLVAGGALVAYFLSRTVGLPGATALTYASFFEPSAVVSLVAEAAFVALFARAFFSRVIATAGRSE
jgi:hypothetical protein